MHKHKIRIIIAVVFVLFVSAIVLFFFRPQGIKYDSTSQTDISHSSASASSTKNNNSGTNRTSDDASDLSSDIPPQFIVFAFDGSADVDMWKKTRAFAREMNASGTPLHFTYLINTPYLIEQSHKDVYQGPHHARGDSNLFFAENVKMVEERIEQMNGAYREGNELGAHAVGHFDGSTWSHADWESELSQFFDELENIHAIDTDLPADIAFDFDPRKEMNGFRAPLLADKQSALLPVLKNLGFEYDASTDENGVAWPKQIDGIWEYSVNSTRIGPSRAYVLVMDYNLFYVQTGAKNTLKRGTREWENARKEALAAYEFYFNNHYHTNHSPIFIANHFSLWNDGLYWQVMQDFAKEECAKPHVVCGSFKELTHYLNSVGPQKVAGFNSLRFSSVSP